MDELSELLDEVLDTLELERKLLAHGHTGELRTADFGVSFRPSKRVQELIRRELATARARVYVELLELLRELRILTRLFLPRAARH